MKTFKLSIQEYNSPFTMNFKENVLKLVNKESTLDWAKRNETTPLPKYEILPSQKLTVGFQNFISQLKP